MTIFTPRAESPAIQVADIAYLRFGRRDLARAERYFSDFGLKLSARTESAIYLRGVLPQHHCIIVEASRHDTFLAVGPHLAVLERNEFAYLDELTLTLAVNGEVRQHDETRNLVYKPAETITELSTFTDISPGDVLRGRDVAWYPTPREGPGSLADSMRELTAAIIYAATI